MADPILKFPPEQKGAPPAKPRIRIAAEPRRRLLAAMRRYRRALLLVVLPLVALLAGLTFYLNGGRYVTTDDAYVGAQKVLITPDVSGKIINIAVKEGQSVSTGDVMFQIDPVPFQLAVAQARAKLTTSSPTSSSMIRPSNSSTPASRSNSATSIARLRSPRTISARSSTSTTAPPRWSQPRPNGNWSRSKDRPRLTSCSATPTCRSNGFRPTCRPRPRSTTPSATSI
jgi:hypothetical protein